MPGRRFRGTIEVRTERVLVIHPATSPIIRWCLVCRRETSMVVPEAAARHWNVSIRTLYRWVEAGKVHFIEVSGGILVCLNSNPKTTQGDT